MERKAHYALIGLFTFAVVAGAFGFIFWLHHSSGKKQAVSYRVIFDSSVSGLQVGGNVLFNGIRVGEVTNLRLDPDNPRQVVALLAVNKATPIRSDTRVGLEFAGLTGVAAVSLKGVSANYAFDRTGRGRAADLAVRPERQPGHDAGGARGAQQGGGSDHRQSGGAASGDCGYCRIQRIACAEHRQCRFDHERRQRHDEQRQGCNGLGAHAYGQSR